MCDLGLNPETFNPRLLYIFRHTVNSHSKVTLHVHDFVEFKYILSGTCVYQIDGEDFHVKKGDIIVCNPGIYHLKKLAAGEELTEVNAAFNNFCIENLPKDFLIEEGFCPVISQIKQEQDFYRCIDDMLVEQENNGPGCALMLKSFLIKLMIIFLKSVGTYEEHEKSVPISFESHERPYIVDTIIAFMQENYWKEISLERISRNMFLSPVYISKIFKEETGESPISYLIKLRLTKARDLLQEGSLSIKSVAKSVGYDDAYYFSKLYKKYYGESPSKHKAV